MAARMYREIAAFHPRAVTQVATFVFHARSPGCFLGMNLVAGTGHFDFPLDIVEDEKLGLRAKIGGVADTGGFQVRLSALRYGARIAVVTLHGGGLHHVAAQYDCSVVGEGVQQGRAIVRHQDHV